MSGWIRVERKMALAKHDFFAPEPMTEREAWYWLLAKATYKDTEHHVGGKPVPVPRGSYMTTLRALQAAWRWRSDTRVRNFLKRLEVAEMIKRTTCGPKNAPKTHVTICKYEEYQGGESAENAPKTHEKRSKVTNNNITTSSNEEDSVREAVQIWNSASQQTGWPKVEKITKPRISAMRSRLADCGGIDGWRTALIRASRSPFLTGQTSKPFFASFDWLTKPANFTKLIEGNYDERVSTNNKTSNSRRGGSHDGLIAGFAAFANSDDDAGGGGSFGGGETLDASYQEMDCRQGGYASQPILHLVNSG